jgi:hypothetical protein
VEVAVPGDARDTRPGKLLAEFHADASTLDLNAFCQRHGQWFFVHHPASSPIRATDGVEPTRIVSPWDDPVDTLSGCEKRPNADLRYDVFPVLRKPGAQRDYLWVGRNAAADVRIPDSHVSKFHAMIRRRSDGSVSIEDGGSKNGTYINDRRVHSARNGAPVRLDSGMRVRFGEIELTFLSAADFCAFCVKTAADQTVRPEAAR